MDIEELKSAWQKKNKELEDNNNDYNIILLNHKSWFKRNRVAIEGILCIILSLFLIVMLFIQNFNFINLSTLFLYASWFIIAIYTLIKGIFSILFFIKSCKLSTETSKFILIHLKNQLYLVYEKMIWLWLLLPLIIIIFPFIILKFFTLRKDTILIYAISTGICYLIALLVFSKSLWNKRKRILTKIQEIDCN
ncbi:MAG: hypothetical protein ACOX4D_02805 [Bacteroidales bacterium]|jgi:hypothetical protein